MNFFTLYLLGMSVVCSGLFLFFLADHLIYEYKVKKANQVLGRLKEALLNNDVELFDFNTSLEFDSKPSKKTKIH
jgi:hypothetical protein